MPHRAPNLDEAMECRANEPIEALEIDNEYIRRNPFDPAGYFSRHLTWERLGEHQKALTDCNRVMQLESDSWNYFCRALIHRNLGDHMSAVADFDRMRELDHEEWLTSFGPHFRADSLARIGRLDDALADCKFISDDHWMPEHSALPGGNKREFIEEIKRRATVARRR